MKNLTKVAQIAAIVGTVVAIIALFISEAFRESLSHISISPITVILSAIIAGTVIIVAPLSRRTKKYVLTVLGVALILWVSWQIYTIVHISDKTRILIAEFNAEKATKKADVADRIYDHLTEKLKQMKTSDILVKKTSEPIGNSEQAREQGYRLRSRVCIVIWGEYDDYGIRPHFEIIKIPLKEEFKPIELPEIPIGIETEELKQFSLYIVKGLPKEMTCLTAFTLGLAHYLEGEYTRAIEYFDIAIANVTRDTNSVSQKTIYQHMAHTYTNIKKYDYAISSLKNILELDPNDCSTYREIGFIYQLIGNYDSAIAFYKKAIELDPQEGLARHHLIRCYYCKEQWNDVIMSCKELIESHKANSTSYYYLATAYRKMGLRKEAIEAFERIKHRYYFPKFPQASEMPVWLEIAVLTIEILGCSVIAFCVVLLLTKAIIKRKAIKGVLLFIVVLFLMWPVYPFILRESYFILGNLYQVKGRDQVSIKYYKKVIESYPKYSGAYNNLGLLYLNKGEYDKAAECFNRAIELNPKNAFAHNNLGIVYTRKGEYDKNIQYFKQATKLDPKSASFWSNLGSVFHNSGEYDKAFECYKKAIELDPKDALSYVNIGCLYNEKGEFDKAIKYYSKAIELDPKDVWAYSYLGVAHHNKGEYDKGLEYCKKAIELGPKVPFAYINLGVIIQAQGKQKEAEQLFEKAEELIGEYKRK